MSTKNKLRFSPTSGLICLLLSLPLVSCGNIRGAPSFDLFGAYFPGWMFCVVIGTLAAIGARTLFVAVCWADVLPYQLFVCSSIGLIFGLLVWLLWFGL